MCRPAFLRFTAVIDQGKQLDALGFEDFLKLFDGLLHRVMARYVYDSCLRNWCHGFLLPFSQLDYLGSRTDIR